MIYLIEDNGYDAQNIYEYTEEDFISVLHTGKYGGCVRATDIQREVINGNFTVVQGNEIPLKELMRIKDTGKFYPQ